MTGADTPSITVRQYGDAASIRSLILRQPDNTEFLLCWKGKYIVGITHVPAESHFNVRYEYANNAVIAHDFFADDPYPGVLTIEASESSDPTPVADFETELRAFLQTVGVSNVALSRVAQLDWWNTNAAYYEVPVLLLVELLDESEDTYFGLKYGDQVIAPKVTINGVTGYLRLDSGGFDIDNISPSCPQSETLFSDKIMNVVLSTPATDVSYNIAVSSCDVNDGIMAVLTPASQDYPTVRIRGVWSTNSLRCLFVKNDVIAISNYDYSDMTVGQTIGIMANEVPCRMTKVSDSQATLEASNIGSPLNAPFHQSRYANNVTYYSDLYEVRGYDYFGQDDIVEQMKDSLSVTTVTTTRAAVNIEDCTYSTEV